MSIHGLTFLLNDRKIFLGSFCAIRVTLLQSVAFEILRKDLLLKDLGYPKFSSPFDLEPFELFDLSIEIKDHISLL